MKLIQISDCHLFADKQKCGYNNINPYQSLQLLLDQALILNPDLLIVTGDISGDCSEQSYHHFIELVQQANLDKRLITIPGNHDDSQYYFTALEQFHLCSEKPKTLGQWQMHGINTMHKGTLGKVSQKELQDIATSVTRSPNLDHIICCHHHPIDCQSWMDKHEWINRQAFTDLVSLHPNIKAVIYGHIHMATDKQKDHCLYLSVPSSCWQWAATPEFAVANESPGMRILDLQEGGKLTTSIQRLTNEKM